MSVRPVDPGRRVGSGHLRVDAKRAIEKLRDYQLPDPTHWVLEAIRAGVAAGASDIALSGDSDDVWLRWSGDPLPEDAIAQLLHELISPRSNKNQPLRLLGTAVNTALGFAVYVDVWTTTEAGPVVARYDKSTVASGGEDAGTAELDRTREPPSEIPERGVLMHVRRGLFDKFRNLLRGEPPELLAARENCRDLAVPLRVDGLADTALPRDLLTVPLSGGVDGFVALTAEPIEPLLHTAAVDLAEHGVVITRQFKHITQSQTQCAAVPLRAFVTAPRMPTNASRSDVRMDTHPTKGLQTKLEQATAALVGKLVAELGSSTDPERAEDLRRAAVRLLAASCAGANWAHTARAVKGPLAPLARAPLLTNAVGAPRAAADSWRVDMVHDGEQALARGYASFLDDVLWARCQADRTLVGQTAVSRVIGSELYKSLTKQVQARRAFFDHAPREPVLEDLPPHLVRAQFGSAPPASVTGKNLMRIAREKFSGELCVLATGSGGWVTVLFHGRPLEYLELESPVPFTAVISTDTITPAADYRAVERDHRFSRLERVVWSQVVAAVEGLCTESLPHRMTSGGVDLPTPALGLLAAGAASIACRLSVEIAPQSPLGTMPMFALAGGGRVSIADIRAHGEIGSVETESAPDIPDRPMVVAPGSLHWTLEKIVEPASVVRYRDWVPVHSMSDHIASDPELVVELLATHIASLDTEIEIDGVSCAGAVVWGVQSSRVRMYHAGKLLRTVSRLPRLGPPCLIAVDAATAVPDSDWSPESDLAGTPKAKFTRWERAMAQAVARTLLGDDVDGFHSRSPVTPGTGVGRSFLVALGTSRDLHLLIDQQLAERLRAAKWWKRIGMNGAFSADDLIEAFDDAIPYLASNLFVNVPDFHPLEGDKVIADAVSNLAGRRVIDGQPELENRAREHNRQRRRRTHLAKPELPWSLPDADQTATMKSASIRGLVALSNNRGATLDIRCDSRQVTMKHATSAIPLVALFEVPAAMTQDYRDVSEDVLAKLVTEAKLAARELLVEHIERSPTDYLTVPFSRVTLLDYAREAHTRGDGDAVISAARSARMFRAVDGGVISLDDATESVTKYADWQGDWLLADPDRPDKRDDDPIIRAGQRSDPRALELLELLAPGVLFDVTDEILATQLVRRAAQGKVEVPRLSSTDPAVRRELSQIGGAKLGIGELALTFGVSSSVHLYHRGMQVATVDLGDRITPPVEAAAELPEFADELGSSSFTIGEDDKRSLASKLAPLARRLLADVVKGAADASTPEWVRRVAVRALLAGDVPPSQLDRAPLFHTTTGDVVAYKALRSQNQQFGCVWWTHAPSNATPLHKDRIAIALSAEEIPPLMRCQLTMLDATEELRLDAVARENRAREPIKKLVLGPAEREGAFVVTELEGAGKKSLRGFVAPLRPSSAHLAGVYVYRRLRFLGRLDDPCEWPTVSVIDDGRFVPNRTHSGPKDDATWKRTQLKLREVSHKSLAKLFRQPKDALTSRKLQAEIKGPSGFSVAGRMWLRGDPEPAFVTMHHSGGQSPLVANAEVHGRRVQFAVHGMIYVHPAPDAAAREQLRVLIASGYRDMLRRLVRKHKSADEARKDTLAAHLAYGLALDIAHTQDADGVEFPCTSPAPSSARELLDLLLSEQPVLVGEPAPRDADQPPMIVDDGTTLATTLIDLCGPRVQRAADPPTPQREPEPTPARASTPPRKPPPPPDPIAHAIYARLTELGMPTSIDVAMADVRSPLARSNHRRVELAGKHPSIAALRAAHGSGASGLAASLDLLAVHVITVLNRGLFDITDAGEALVLGRLIERRAHGR